MTVAILATAAVIGRLSRSLPFAVWLLLAPGFAYAASPRWARLHLWGPVFGVHTGSRVAPRAIAAAKPATAPSTKLETA